MSLQSFDVTLVYDDDDDDDGSDYEALRVKELLHRVTAYAALMHSIARQKRWEK